MNSILNLLSKYIEIKQCKNNKKIYISKTCPFCGEESKRIFRYNTKLRVGKSYCCGNSFKEIYWLKKQLIDKDFADKFKLKNKHGLYTILSDKVYQYIKFKDKMSKNINSFEKSKYDDDLPF